MVKITLSVDMSDEQFEQVEQFARENDVSNARALIALMGVAYESIPSISKARYDDGPWFEIERHNPEQEP